MIKSGDKVKVSQSNGLTFRDGPHPFGGIIFKIPNDTVLAVTDVLDVEHLWINFEYNGRTGWAVADDKLGTVNVKVLAKPKKAPKKPRKKTYPKKKPKKTIAS